MLALEGSLFFGTAGALRARLGNFGHEVDLVVLDLRQVREIDVTGARILFEIAQDWSSSGKRRFLAERPVRDPRRRTLVAIAGPQATGVIVFEDHAEGALERAEDELLERFGIAEQGLHEVDLGDTALACGLDADELRTLLDATTLVRFARGSVLFRRGDPGDALYLSLAGNVGLHVTGSSRRLTAFAAGVSLGEIAVLAHGHRTVDAVAESDVVALRLPAEAFDRWRSERPNWPQNC